MTFSDRRTIRQYKADDVPQKLLNEMLALAARASNTGNMQTYSVVVTRSAEQKRLLMPAHFNQPMVEQAPVVLTFSADYNRFVKWCILRNAEPGYDNFQSFIGAMIDAVIFAQTFACIAEERGLGICYLGTTTYNAEQIIKVLHLPKRVVPICTLTLGYPAQMPQLQDRLPLRAFVHEEMYQDFDDAEIDELYREKESNASSLKYIEENHKQTLAQVFTDVRYTKANCEFFSDEFINVLRKQLFL